MASTCTTALHGVQVEENPLAENTAPSASILFVSSPNEPAIELVEVESDAFGDLNLDQLVADVTAGRDQYELRPYFFTPLTSAAAVQFRHAVIQDLAQPRVRKSIHGFAEGMRAMRTLLAEADSLRYRQQKQRVALEAVTCYLRAVGGLASGFMDADLASSGMLRFRDQLDQYVASEAFSTLAEDADQTTDRLEQIRYEFLIEGGRISVFPLTEEADYSADVAATFSKFRQSEVASKLQSRQDPVAMNHVEAGILGLVGEVFPDQFDALARFVQKHAVFQSAMIARFDREVQFYLAYLEYLERIPDLATCLPTVTREPTSSVRDAVDLVLAAKLAGGAHPVVGNDFSLTGEERVLVVTGANQGGKTTFARAFGQLHYLAALGLPVAASSATLHLFDRVFTHFERQENLQNLTGKLEDDLLRVHAILQQASGESIVILNEIFTSTTVSDALFLGTQILDRIITLGALGVYVTFVDELSALGPGTVSMVAEVDPAEVTTRTFRIRRRPADGLAHATAMAARYGLTATRLRERIHA